MKFIGTGPRKTKSKLLIKVKKCENSTASSNCASQEEITDFFEQRLWIALFIPSKEYFQDRFIEGFLKDSHYWDTIPI